MRPYWMLSALIWLAMFCAAPAVAQGGYDGLPEEEKALIDELAGYLELSPRDLADENGDATPETQRAMEDWMARDPVTAFDFLLRAAEYEARAGGNAESTAGRAPAPVPDNKRAVNAPEQRASPPAPNLASAASEAELLALIDRVPKAHRPVAVRVFSQLNFIPGFSGGTTSHTVYPVYFFSNGKATNCHNVNPLTLDIQAAVNAEDANGCEEMKWRKTGAEYEAIGPDETEWYEYDVHAGVKPFRRGERPDVGLVATDGFVLDTAIGYTSTTSYYGLKMQPDGTLIMDGESVTAHTGGNVVAYGTGQSGAKTFRYAVDGHLIALDDGSGPTLMYIAPAYEGNVVDNVYFADSFYYDDSD